MKTDEKTGRVRPRKGAPPFPRRIQRENYAGGARGELAAKTGSKIEGRSTAGLCHSARAGDCISMRSNGSGVDNWPLRQMSQLRPCGPLCQWCSRTALNTTSRATAAKTASTGRQRVLSLGGITLCILQDRKRGSKRRQLRHCAGRPPGSQPGPGPQATQVRRCVPLGFLAFLA